MSQAVEGLLNLEKSSRLAEDITATKACCSAVLDVCSEAKNWRALEENVLLITKRRGQLKQVGAAVCFGMTLWQLSVVRGTVRASGGGAGLRGLTLCGLAFA